MPRITPISWKVFERFLFAVGCEFKRERRDHRIYWKKRIKRPLVVHREKQLPVFVIRNNLRVLGMSQQDYLEILAKL